MAIPPIPNTSWRSFKFFQGDQVKGPLETLEITSCCVGRNSYFFGDGDGYVRNFDRAGRTQLFEFAGYAGPVTHMKHLRTRNVLITIGDDDSINTGIIRVWDLDKKDSSTGRPSHREHRLFGPKTPYPTETTMLRTNFNPEVMRKLKFYGKTPEGMSDGSRPGILMADFRTAIVEFDVSEDLQHLAVALTTGDILIVKGDLERDRSLKVKSLRSSFSKKSLSFVGFVRTRVGAGVTQQTSNNNALGGFLSVVGGSSHNSAGFAQLLYAVYADAVCLWRITHKAEYQEYVCHQAVGAIPECCAMSDDGQLVVAASGTNQIFFFGDETMFGDLLQRFEPTRLQVYKNVTVDGEKLKVLFYKHYILLLTQAKDSRADRFTLQAYDPENTIRALSKQQEVHVNVAWLLTDATDMLVIAQEPKATEVLQRITRFTEEDTQSKLEQLFSKECYDIAKRMASKLSTDDKRTQQMNIQKKYGDHLYAKGKFSEAIDQYIEAIGYLEPSYVIRQFLDSQRIHHLTRYLQELHREDHCIANRNHTTLLLNCFTKLRDEESLNKFIRRNDLRFDAHNAIKVCRQAGYFEQATYLADRYHEPVDYVKIQLENLNQPLQAIRYIRNLAVHDAEAIMKQHGKELVLLVADEATEVLIELCTKWGGPPRGGQAGGGAATSPGKTPAENNRMSRYHRDGEGQGTRQVLPPHRSLAQGYIHAFVDSPLCLLRFLRSVVDSGELDHDTVDDEMGQRVVYNTLLELYLTKDLKKTIRHLNPNSSDAHSHSGNENHSQTAAASAAAAAPAAATRTIYTAEPYSKRLEHAFQILKAHQGKYDDYHALALVQQHNFEPGIIFLLGELKLYREIFTHYTSVFENSPDPQARRRAKEKLLQTCKQQQQQQSQGGRGGHGSDDADETEKEMWISLLSLLVRSQDDCSQDIAEVLEYVERRDILPPVAVIEILSTNRDMELRTVRDYVIRMLSREAQKTDVHAHEIKEYTEKKNTIRKEITELQQSATVFQTNKCTHCGQQLDFPAVHFLCRHSYHQRCINDGLECNVCASENRKVIQLQRELEEASNEAATFFRVLGDRKDGASVVAEYFGRGIFSAPRLKKDASLMGTGPVTFDNEEGLGGGAFERVEDDEEEDMGLGYFDDDLENPEQVELW